MSSHRTLPSGASTRTLLSSQGNVAVAGPVVAAAVTGVPPAALLRSLYQHLRVVLRRDLAPSYPSRPSRTGPVLPVAVD